MSEIRRVGEHCPVSTLRSEFYIRRLDEFLRIRTGKEEESRSDNQEQGDVDGTGKVEN